MKASKIAVVDVVHVLGREEWRSLILIFLRCSNKINVLN